MYNNIIMITSYFPYSSGEAFIENEIDYLVKSEDSIYFYPIYTEDTSYSRIDQKKNVNVYDGSLVRPKLTILLYILKGIFSKIVIQEIAKLIKTHRISINSVHQLFMFWANAESKIRIIKKDLCQKVKEDEKTIIYAYWMHEHAYISIRLAEFFHTKCITRCHRYDLYEYSSETNYLPFRDYIINNMDAIFPISNDGEKYLKDHYHIKDSVIIRRSYLGTKDYGISPTKKDEAISIVSCSNIVTVKHIDLLINALKHIDEQSIIWTHFGDGPLYNDMMNLASTTLPPNIKWIFKGKLSNAELMTEYKHNYYDIFINTSISEGLPVSIMEAISFGIPVIATDVGGTSEIVHDGENGWLIKKDISAIDLAEIIKSAVSDETRLSAYRINARQIWEDNFSSERNYSKFYSAIDNL